MCQAHSLDHNLLIWSGADAVISATKHPNKSRPCECPTPPLPSHPNLDQQHTPCCHDQPPEPRLGSYFFFVKIPRLQPRASIVLHMVRLIVPQACSLVISHTAALSRNFLNSGCPQSFFFYRPLGLTRSHHFSIRSMSPCHAIAMLLLIVDVSRVQKRDEQAHALSSVHETVV